MTKLLDLPPEKRGEIPGISANRTDAIHLGALLFVALLQDGQGKYINHLRCISTGRDDHPSHRKAKTAHWGRKSGKDPAREKAGYWLANRYETELEAKKHVSGLALQLFDQLKHLHQAGEQERSMLYHAALVYDVGLYV